MHDDPILPEDVTGEELDADARAELRTLPKELAAKVARHLVMAGRLGEDEPERAYKHARTARRLASRVGVVREAAGIAAYHAGEWAEALAELRAARRLSAGDVSYLPVMADCERGLGRPERALDLIKSAEAAQLDPMGRVELRIVESGVRRDLGQQDAAVVTLQIPELRDRRLRPWSMRLFYAYADALVEAGREDEASDWFARAAAADRDGETDAAERYAELEGLHIVDTEEDELNEHAPEAEDLESAALPEALTAPDHETAPGDVAVRTDEAVRKGEVPGDEAAPGQEAAQSDEAAPGQGAAQSDEAVPAKDALPETGPVQSQESASDTRAVSDGEGAEGAEGGLGDRAVAGEEALPEVEAVQPEETASGGSAVTEQESAEPDEAGSEAGSATDIVFMDAGSEVAEAAEDEAPEVPAVFLEPKPVDGERPPQAE